MARARNLSYLPAHSTNYFTVQRSYAPLFRGAMKPARLPALGNVQERGGDPEAHSGLIEDCRLAQGAYLIVYCLSDAKNLAGRPLARRGAGLPVRCNEQNRGRQRARDPCLLKRANARGLRRQGAPARAELTEPDVPRGTSDRPSRPTRAIRNDQYEIGQKRIPRSPDRERPSMVCEISPANWDPCSPAPSVETSEHRDRRQVDCVLRHETYEHQPKDRSAGRLISQGYAPVEIVVTGRPGYRTIG